MRILLLLWLGIASPWGAFAQSSFPTTTPMRASLWTNEDRKSVFDDCMRRKAGGPWVPPHDHVRFCDCYQKKMERDNPEGVPTMTHEMRYYVEQQWASACIK
jgi:hypothetical protein